MKTRDRLAGMGSRLALTAMLATAAVSGAATAQDAGGISAEPLSQRHALDGNVAVHITQKLDGLPEHTITRDDASHIIVVRFTIQPGAVFPWHTHPGTVLVNITEGDFVFVFAEDCVHREYGPGDALIDPGDSVHTAYNPSEDHETVVMAVLIGAPAEGALTIPVADERGADLDTECGIDRG